jgi:NACHT domain
MSDPASKKPRWESETDTILQMLAHRQRERARLEFEKLAASARQQRERIRLEIEKLDRLAVLPPKNVVSPPKDAVSSSKDVSPPRDVSPPEDVVSPSKRALRSLRRVLWPPKGAVPPSKGAVPLSKDAVSPSKDAVLPSKDAVPPSKDAVPPSKDAVPPSKDIVPSSKDVVSCPNSVLHLSNPTFDTKLPFPFVGQMIPGRFKVNGKDNESNWFYTGREKFAELRKEFERVRNSPQHSALIIYGTRGYGKSHLLAAFVCCLAASEEKVVYIPDCREFMNQPIQYIRAAILFAWADDKSEQQTIMALDSLEKIDQFFQGQSGVVFVIDQLNALEKEEGDDEPTITEKARLRVWLQRLRATGKALLSSSANNHSILNKALKQSSEKVVYVYGGLTEVGLSNNSSVKKGRF